MASTPNIPTVPPRWYLIGGDDDDFAADWAGLLLRVEQMDQNYWWWAVSDHELRGFGGEPGDQVASSYDFPQRPTTGAKARAAAEKAARAYLERKWRQNHWMPREKKPQRRRGRNANGYRIGLAGRRKRRPAQ